MLITESRVKAIIQEEIQKMMEEGEIDEGWFSDTLGGVGRKAVGRVASAIGVTPDELAAQQKATAAQKTAAQEKTVAAQKEKAKVQVAKKVQDMQNKISVIETSDVDELYELAKALGYKGGDHPYMNPEPIRRAANELAKRLDTILKDIKTGKLAEETLEETEE